MSQRSARSHSPARVYREGINLYKPQPESETQAAQIEEGRDDEMRKLASLGGRNTVVHMGEFTQASGKVDRFRVTTTSPGAFEMSQLSAIMKRYPSQVTVGESGKVCFVNVPHRRYDKRVVCLDLTRCQCLGILVLLICIACLFYAAYDVDRFARFDDKNSWLARAISTHGVVTSFEI